MWMQNNIVWMRRMRHKCVWRLPAPWVEKRKCYTVQNVSFFTCTTTNFDICTNASAAASRSAWSTFFGIWIVSILNIMSTSWLYTRLRVETLYAVPGICLHISRVHVVGACWCLRICLHLHLCILNLKWLPNVVECCVVAMNCDEGFIAGQFNYSLIFRTESAGTHRKVDTKVTRV